MKLADPDDPLNHFCQTNLIPKYPTDLDRGPDFPGGGADLFDDAPPALAPRLAS